MQNHDTLPVTLRLVQGHFDEVLRIPPKRMLVRGWVLSPEEKFDSVKVYLNNRLLGVAAREERPDLVDHFPMVAHASQSGFVINLDLSAVASDPYRTFSIVGYQGDRPVGRLVLVDGLDLPPVHLRQRVAGTGEAEWFKKGGFRAHVEFLAAIRRHGDLAAVRHLLDWGCGCGQVTVHLLRSLPGVEIHGSDVDPEAIAWCGGHLGPGNFVVSSLLPPLPFEDATFDAVLAKSVFTHLTRDVQNAWLAELRRVIAPGGLLLPTVHGEFAIRRDFPADVAEQILRDGFSDETRDPVLDEIAPEHYYRSTFQTKAYTLKAWSKYFDVLEYTEKGMLDHQDLVVLRRGAAGSR